MRHFRVSELIRVCCRDKNLVMMTGESCGDIGWSLMKIPVPENVRTLHTPQWEILTVFCPRSNITSSSRSSTEKDIFLMPRK